MTNNELSRFNAILQAKQSEMARLLAKRDGIAIEKAPDALDEVQFATGRELHTRTLEREFRVLREVRAAKARIEEGSYGICLDCEREISPKRLNAVPWASLCISCQEVADRSSQDSADSPNWWSANAA